MRRREFFALTGSVVAWPLEALAQQVTRMRRLALLMGFKEDDKEGQGRVAVLLEALNKLGWKQGATIELDIRWTAGDSGRAAALAREMIDRNPRIAKSEKRPHIGDIIAPALG